MSVVVYELVWSYRRKILPKCAVSFFLFGCLVSFTLDHLCSFCKSWQRWIEGEWNKVQRHACCTRSPKSVAENICKGPLTGKTTNTLKPHKYPLVPLFCLWKQKVLPEKTFSSVVTGFLMIYRLCRLLQTLQISPKKKEKEEWSQTVITGYRVPVPQLHCGWCKNPWHVHGAKEAIPGTWEWLMSARGYISALRLLLCFRKQGNRAPWAKKSTFGRGASSRGGKSMIVTTKDKRDSRGPLGRAGCRHDGWTDTLRTKGILQIF